MLERFERAGTRRLVCQQRRRAGGQSEYGRNRRGSRCHREWRCCWRSRRRCRSRIWRRAWRRGRTSHGRRGSNGWLSRSSGCCIQRRQVGHGGNNEFRWNLGVGWNREDWRCVGPGSRAWFRRRHGGGRNRDYWRLLGQGRSHGFWRCGCDRRRVGVWPRPDDRRRARATTFGKPIL